MKKIIFILAAVFLVLIGCTQSPEKRAQKLVVQYLKNNLHDFSSYESVE